MSVVGDNFCSVFNDSGLHIITMVGTSSPKDEPASVFDAGDFIVCDSYDG